MSNTNGIAEEGKTDIYVNLYGKVVPVDMICLHEADYLRALHKYKYDGILRFCIKRSSILDKALDFCKKRAQIRARYSHDETLLYHALKHFDSDFLKDIQGGDAIDLLGAAAQLDIKSLVDLLYDDVVRMVADKTPEDIEKIFRIRYNGVDTRLVYTNHLLDNGMWHLKTTTTDREILKASPAVFKNLPFEQQRYWVYGHLLFKINERLFISLNQLSKEDEEALREEWKEEEDKYGVHVTILGDENRDENDIYDQGMAAYCTSTECSDEDEDEESKALKMNDAGGSGPSIASWKSCSKPDDQ